MIRQSLSNTNETCYSVQIIKIYDLNKAVVALSFGLTRPLLLLQATLHAARLQVFLTCALGANVESGGGTPRACVGEALNPPQSNKNHSTVRSQKDHAASKKSCFWRRKGKQKHPRALRQLALHA